MHTTIKCTGDFLTKIPKNVIFNKARTGCGGTTVALTNDENYVVCVPYVNAIKGKVKASKENKSLYKHEVLGIYADISEEEILEYLTRNHGKPLKIITTYESVSKIITKKWVEPNNFNLLIDEYHCLIREYVFRNKGVTNVLTWFKDFASYTFMSATPVFQDDFILEELKDIPTVTAVWDKEETYNVFINYCIEGLLTPIARLINQYLADEFKGNLYLFVNSLQIMKKIVRHPDINGALTSENTKLISSTNSIRELPFNGGNITDGVYKKINMLTSTAFEAVDIDDPTGRAVIVADSRLEYTLFDTSTTLLQVLGRLRKSPFRNEISIYVKSKSKQTELTYGEYKDMLLHEKERIEKSLLTLKEKPAKLVEKILKSTFYDTGFIKHGDNEILFDNNYLKYQLWKYRVSHWIFNSDADLEDSIRNSNTKFSIIRKEALKVKEKTPKENLGHFKFCVEKLIELSCKSDFLTNNTAYGNRYAGLTAEEIATVEKAIDRFPYIIRAINEIGMHKMRIMGFNTSNIRRKLISTSDLTHRDKVRESLGLRKLTGKFLSSSEAKKIMEDTYRLLGIAKQPNGTDITKYFNVIHKKKKRSRGFLITNLKNMRE